MTALLTTAIAAVIALGAHPTQPTYVASIVPPPQVCPKTFTVFMAKRAIYAVYAGTRHVSIREQHMLGRIERCQRNPHAIKYVRHLDHQARRAWWQRRHPTMYTQLASWYDDAGGTACGFHAYYGVANKTLPCGTHVIAHYHGRQVTMIVQDRGPYVGGRVWDLNQNTAAALGFSGVDDIQVSILG